MVFVLLFKKTIRSLSRPSLMLQLALCSILAVLLMAGGIGGVTWAMDALVALERGWLDSAVNWLVGIVLGIGGWFMLPVLVMLIAGIFQENTIREVEKNDYPEKRREQEQPFWADLVHDIHFASRALMLNLLILPLYFVGVGAVLSVALNSYLMGREFFESAAGYHLGKQAARELGRTHRKLVYGSGLFLTLLTLVPVVNLFVPVIALIWMVHAHHLVSPGGNTGENPGEDMSTHPA